MASPTASQIRPQGFAWIGERLVALALFLLGFGLMFRPIIAEGFHRSIGDGGDGLILIATLEHWFNVLSGHPVGGGWRDPGFFYPYGNALGLTDNYFVYAIPYCALRLLSVGSLTAYTLVIGMFATIGYWAMYALGRRWPRSATGTAAIGAFVFAFGAMPMFKLYHGQTYTIMLAPAIGLLLLAARRQGPLWRRLAYAGAAGLVYGAILFSAAQTAWFLGFVGMLAMLYWLARARPALAALRPALPLAGCFAAGLAIAFVPTAELYMHGIGLRHARSFAEAKGIFAPFVLDIIQVQPGNLLWFDLLKYLGIAGRPTRQLLEVALGYTPVFLGLTVAGAIVLRRRAPPGRAEADDLAAEACVAGAILAWLLELNYFGTRPWWLVFHLVPGASGIRTPFRIQLAGLFFMCLAYSHIAARLWADALRKSVRRAVGTGLLLTLCVVEQFGPPPLMRRSADVDAWLSIATKPPFPCEAFYLVPEVDPSERWSEHQADAMILSQKIGLPTLNGNSSWLPDGWKLMHTESPDYAANVVDWVRTQHVAGPVCGVDPRAGRWVAGLPDASR